MKNRNLIPPPWFPRSVFLWGLTALSLLTVALSTIIDYCFGSDSSSPPSANGWHFAMAALGGVGCSLLASAYYGLITEGTERWRQNGIRGDLLSLVSSRGDHDELECSIYVPAFNAMHYKLQTPTPTPSIRNDSEEAAANRLQSREIVAGQLEQRILPTAMQAAVDVECARCIEAVFSRNEAGAVRWITTPFESFDGDPFPRGVLIAIGLFSNPVTLKVAGQLHSCQTLLRVGSRQAESGELEYFVRTPCSARGRPWNVEQDHEEKLYGKSRQEFFYILRCRLGDTIVLVVGGLSTEGTSRAGIYFRDYWQRLPGLFDYGDHSCLISDHEYLIEFAIYPTGECGITRVWTGNPIL